MATDTIEEVITITLEEYKELVEASDWLLALQSAGVDSWDGISFAHEIYEEMAQEAAKLNAEYEANKEVE